MPAGVGVLERMGLAEAIGGAPFRGIQYRMCGVKVECCFPVRDGRPATGRGQRRLVLDENLFQSAVNTPGVTSHRGAHVDAPLVENGRVTGLIVNGQAHRGDLVVAADGLNSPIRKALELDMPVRKRRFGLRAHFRLAHGNDQSPWVDVFVGKGHELYVTPLPAGEVLVAALVESGAMAGTPATEYSRWCSAEPELAARLEGAEQISELAGCSPLAAHSRRGVAPGIVLLGDAAGFVDPITGGGMSQALVSAEILSRYAARGLAAADRWLDEFERERNRMLRDYRLLTGIMLWLAERPRIAAGTMRAMRAAPKLCSHLAGVSGDLRPLWSALPVS